MSVRASAFSAAELGRLRAKLRFVLPLLEDAAIAVITERYGLAGGPAMSCVEAGRKLMIPPDRVAELEEAAIARLRELMGKK